MPVDLGISQHVIQSFLAGARLKEAREQRIAEAEARAEALEVQRERIAELAAQFKEKHALETEKVKSKMALDTARANELATRLKATGLNLLTRSKDLVGEGGKSITLEDINKALTENGAAPIIRTQSPQELDQRAINKAGGIAQAQRDIKFPDEISKLREKQSLDMGLAVLRSQLEASQKEKDYKYGKEVAGIRAEGSKTNANLKKEERAETDQQAIDTNLPNIMTGQTTVEQLNSELTGQTRVKVANAARKNGWRIFTKAEQEKFAAGPGQKRFMKDVRLYFNALNNGDLNTARNIHNRLRVDLRNYARNEKGEKGNMSNQDVSDMANALPHWTTFSTKENADRLRRIEDTYFNRMEQTFRGITPTQRRAVEKRWGIIRRLKNPKTGNTYIDYGDEE